MSWRFLSSSRRFERLAGRALRNNSTFIGLKKRDIKELGRYQRSPALSDVLESFQQWCSKPPKGFEKFFKEKPGSKPTKSSSKDAPKEARKSQPKPAEKSEMPDFFKLGQRGGSKGGSGGGGGMGGLGNMPDAEKQKLASMVGLGLVGVLAMIYMNQMNYR